MELGESVPLVFRGALEELVDWGDDFFIQGTFLQRKFGLLGVLETKKVFVDEKSCEVTKYS